MVKKVLLISIALLFGLIVSVWWQWPDENLRIIACDVGQGDGILVLKGFTQVVIDGGPGTKMSSCLGNHVPFWDRQIEMVVMTHPQKDHMEGLLGLIDKHEILLWVGPAVYVDDVLYQNLIEKLANENVKMLVPRSGDLLTVAQINFRVVWPENGYGGKGWWEKAIKSDINVSEYDSESLNISDVNEVSTVLLMSYGKFEALFTGDISAREELAILKGGLITDIDLLKVAHHGSKFASSSEFLEVTKPELALISSGRKNRFGHPTSEVLMRLDAVGAKILRTDELGDVVVGTDGERVWVEEK